MGDLKIGNAYLSTYAYISDASGLLQEPPTRGDLVEMDFQPGAQWIAGQVDAYTFDVPVIMKGSDEGTIIANLRSLQALADGTEYTIKRTFTSGTTSINEDCTGVVTSVTPAWDFGVRKKLAAMIVIQNTSGGWTTSTTT